MQLFVQLCCSSPRSQDPPRLAISPGSHAEKKTVGLQFSLKHLVDGDIKSREGGVLTPHPGPLPILSFPSEKRLTEVTSSKSPVKIKGGRGFPAKVCFRGHLRQLLCAFLLGVQTSQRVRG